MTLNQLLKKLNDLKEKHGNKEISLLIETPEDAEHQIQLEYDLNDIAVSETQNKVILMHEEW